MQRKQAGLRRRWCPIDEDKWVGLSSVRVIELMGKHDITRRVFREF